MHILQAEHPTTPGVILKLFYTRTAAEREGIKLLRIIGDNLLEWLDEIGHESAEERREKWDKLRDREDQPFIVFDKHVSGMLPELIHMSGFDAPEFYVLIDEAQAQDEEEAVRAAVDDAIQDGVLAGGRAIRDGLLVERSTTTSAEQVNSREVKLHNALKLAHSHITAMASFIGDVNKGRISGYSFESLGEDEGFIRDALGALPISDYVARRMEALAAIVGAREPLPTALAMIDGLIAMGGDTARLARFARIALAKVVAAGTELNASLGEAVERHIYNFDNGDEIAPDCSFHAAMKAWADAIVGDPGTYAAPANPLPWTVTVLPALMAGDPPRYLHVIAHDGREVFSEKSPSDEAYRDWLAIVSAINAQPLLGLAAV